MSLSGPMTLLVRKQSKDRSQLFRENRCPHTTVGGHFNLDRRRPHFEHVQRLRCGLREVQHATGDVVPPIGDANVHRLSIFHIEHTHRASQRQFAVGGRVRRHIKGFSIRRQFAMKRLAVPGGDAPILETCVQGQLPFRQGGARSLQNAEREDNPLLSTLDGARPIVIDGALNLKIVPTRKELVVSWGE
jgi:hypothetical protein